jgi:hypothetical protein
MNTVFQYPATIYRPGDASRLPAEPMDLPRQFDIIRSIRMAEMAAIGLATPEHSGEIK